MDDSHNATHDVDGLTVGEREQVDLTTTYATKDLQILNDFTFLKR